MSLPAEIMPEMGAILLVNEALSGLNSKTDRRSTTGYCVSLNENGPLRRSKTQPTVALSTCEAVQECMYLIQLLEGIDAGA